MIHLKGRFFFLFFKCIRVVNYYKSVIWFQFYLVVVLSKHVYLFVLIKLLILNRKKKKNSLSEASSVYIYKMYTTPFVLFNKVSFLL